MEKVVVELMKEISNRVHKGEKNGIVKCPYCGGDVDYVYGNIMAMRAKCKNCDFSITA